MTQPAAPAELGRAFLPGPVVGVFGLDHGDPHHLDLLDVRGCELGEADATTPEVLVGIVGGPDHLDRRVRLDVAGAVEHDAEPRLHASRVLAGHHDHVGVTLVVYELQGGVGRRHGLVGCGRLDHLLDTWAGDFSVLVALDVTTAAGSVQERCEQTHGHAKFTDVHCASRATVVGAEYSGFIY